MWDQGVEKKEGQGILYNLSRLNIIKCIKEVVILPKEDLKKKDFSFGIFGRKIYFEPKIL